MRVGTLAEGTQASLKTSWYLLGPAFVAAIAYVDPGNVAANVSSGAQFGYLLLWAVTVWTLGEGASVFGKSGLCHPDAAKVLFYWVCDASSPLAAGP